MKVIIAGGRDISNRDRVFAIIDRDLLRWKEEGLPAVTEIMSGCARGVDTLGEQYAAAHNIPVKKFPADWDVNGKAAGPIRNRQMADYADRLIVIMHIDSKGSKNMYETMKKLGKHGCAHIVTDF